MLFLRTLSSKKKKLVRHDSFISSMGYSLSFNALLLIAITTLFFLSFQNFLQLHKALYSVLSQQSENYIEA